MNRSLGGVLSMAVSNKIDGSAHTCVGSGNALWFRNRLLAFSILGLGLLLGACGRGSDKPLDTLDPIGKEAQTIDKLVRPVFLIAIVISSSSSSGSCM